jgi:hypothetical protein
VEWHGEERQLLRIAVVPKRSTVATVGMILAVLLSLWGLADGALVVSFLLGGASAAVACRTVWECGTASAVLVDGARRVVDEGIELGGRGQTSERSSVERPAATPVPERAWVRATG